MPRIKHTSYINRVLLKNVDRYVEFLKELDELVDGIYEALINMFMDAVEVDDDEERKEIEDYVALIADMESEFLRHHMLNNMFHLGFMYALRDKKFHEFVMDFLRKEKKALERKVGKRG